jgi:hypothetical protein
MVSTEEEVQQLVAGFRSFTPESESGSHFDAVADVRQHPVVAASNEYVAAERAFKNAQDRLTTASREVADATAEVESRYAAYSAKKSALANLLSQSEVNYGN